MVKQKKSADVKSARLRKADKKQPKGKLIPLLFAIGLLLFLVSGITYYTQVYTNPRNVFWDMIDNNLATKGITRQVIQEDDTTISNEVAQFNFGTPTAVKLTRTLTSADESSGNVTQLEGLGLAENDFQRYIKVVRTGDEKALQDFNKVLNQWVLTGSNDQSKGAEASTILLRSLLGPVLYGNLSAVTRQSIVDDFMASNVYTVDFNKVEKTKENGKSVYKFNASVNLKKFVTVMNKYALAMGIPGAESINPSSYQDSDKIDVVLSVDLRSRQLVKVSYAGSKVNESYSGYGVTSKIEEPKEYLTSEQFRQLIGQ